jgi:hypothetical protein
MAGQAGQPCRVAQTREPIVNRFSTPRCSHSPLSHSSSSASQLEEQMKNVIKQMLRISCFLCWNQLFLFPQSLIKAKPLSAMAPRETKREKDEMAIMAFFRGGGGQF